METLLSGFQVCFWPTIVVSQDHKPDQTDERRRIEDAGGFVMWAGTWRVGGVLAVSSAFGDRLLKRYVVADPEIQGFSCSSDSQFQLCLARSNKEMLR
ncbi:probable protein phosphatase 2C 59 isoform X2 [Vigna radiata var. radiata]|uniref:Probable protein phosphatase 2C 59 isoform X2 n=1 Tax=Vigna radiata var. radiata TaxID=3916 RepID=A0A1S3VS37_VIGRR|nr:probable protein phosphatase 2C 59 isoform X2 [Vigna radiata var. radiata]